MSIPCHCSRSTMKIRVVAETTEVLSEFQTIPSGSRIKLLVARSRRSYAACNELNLSNKLHGINKTPTRASLQSSIAGTVCMFLRPGRGLRDCLYGMNTGVHDSMALCMCTATRTVSNAANGKCCCADALTHLKQGVKQVITLAACHGDQERAETLRHRVLKVQRTAHECQQHCYKLNWKHEPSVIVALYVGVCCLQYQLK